MKMPAALSRFDSEAMLNFGLRHGDKIGLTLFGLIAAWMLWSGITTWRIQSPEKQMLPDAIMKRASESTRHINAEPQPPAKMLVREVVLSRETARWEAPEVIPSGGLPVLDKPLFNEFAKRTKPDVMPIEEIVATAGIAVIGAEPQPEAMAGESPERPRDVPPPRGDRGRQPRDRGFARPENIFEPDGDPTAGMGEADEGVELAAGRIMPFVVVTGLVPYDRQSAEYQRRFSQAGYQDEKRDSPMWSEYRVERTEIRAGEEPQWTAVSLRDLARETESWMAAAAEILPQDCLLTEVPGLGSRGAGGGGGRGGRSAAAGDVSPLNYALPLPERIDEPWGLTAIHPWFETILEERGDEQEGLAPGRAEPAQDVAEIRPDFFEGEEGMPGAGGGREGAMPGERQEQQRTAKRLFRFIDTDVEPGRSYRYRVTLSIWNPNWKLHPRHLADPQLAKTPKLISPVSEPSAAVRVPDPVSLLVRTLDRDAMRRLKRDRVEAIVLGEDPRSGNYALRSVAVERGSLANVDETALNRPGDTRCRGQSITTDRVLLDMLGEQERDDDPRRRRRSSEPEGPREPVEMIFLKPDGELELVNLAESQRKLDRYQATLPAGEGTDRRGRDDRREMMPEGPGPGFAPRNPFGSTPGRGGR
jgi:hypothetical protein